MPQTEFTGMLIVALGGVVSFVYSKVYTVDELKGDRAVLDKQGIHTAFNIKDLELAS